MAVQADILSRFAGGGHQGPLYLPDLTLWYETHQVRGTLPDPWKEASLPRICRELGVPAWVVARPWQVESTGVEVRTSEQEGERVTVYETSAGTLKGRWTLGSDNTWWQMEYPVKSAADLEVALEVAGALSYVLDPSELTQLEAEVGDEGIVALEIPTRPYADLLYDLVGLSEGPILLSEDPPAARELIDILETKLQAFVAQIALLSGSVVFSPDNLDAQFISPMVFQEFLAESYSRTAEVLHQHGKYLLVHAGGPIRPLLAPLAAAGVDGVEGIAGPPQGDVSLARAREEAGAEMTLWGGIPQDFLLAARAPEEFEEAVQQAVREAAGDSRLLLGVADRVPVDSELSRLEAIPSLIENV